VLARLLTAPMIAFVAAPALAGGASVQIPEPGDAALFVIAVVGLIVGRHVSRKAPRRDD